MLSRDFEELIAAKLGNPTHDPHGDPIPTQWGRLEDPATRSLQSLEPGEGGQFTRISDSDPEMLRCLFERGIAPGACFEVVDKQPFEGPLSARFGEAVHVIGGQLAQAMWVRETR